MFVKICGQMEGQRDDTIIECDQVRFFPDPAERNDGKVVRMLHIRPTNKREASEIEWLVSGDTMQVYLLNNEGKTIDRLW